MAGEFNYEWYWIKKLPERKGQKCAVLVRENKMNSILVCFQIDNFKVVTSKWAVRRIKREPPTYEIPLPTDEQIQLWEQIQARAYR